MPKSIAKAPAVAKPKSKKRTDNQAIQDLDKWIGCY